MRPRQQRRSSSTTGTMLVLIGAAAVLGTTFATGVYLGRSWPRGGEASITARSAEREARRAGPRGDRPRPDAPTLTFYQELTAPLTAPPPPKARPAKAAAREGAAPATNGPPATLPDATPLAPAAAPTRPGYTIQVAAYRAREPAERLRATLAAAGHDAQIVEIDAPGVARYRVRVGAFVTREAARQAAARLSDERSLATFVTAR